jgi:tight adherence protein C
MQDQQLLLFCIAAMVALAVFGISRALFGDKDKKLRQRLAGEREQTQTGPNEPATSAAGGAAGNVAQLVEKISTAAAQPFMPSSREKQSSMRRDLAYAGIYSPAAFKAITGARAIFLMLGLGGGYLMGLTIDNMLLGVPVGGLIGYFVPKMWLKMRIKANQKQLTQGLPDALDLMVVCVEAGLTVDAAMQRVGEEMILAHPSLSRELGIAHMETRVGLSRQESLKNLGARTGNAAIQSLAAMLIQADRFGTSIANALRIHAESLRQKRQHAAEEMAAKASVKMSFPLVLFIFPATFIVLAGPTVIGLMRSALFND